MLQTSKDSNPNRRVSMTIYSSDKAVPYVYLCTHKETGKFYIGYRMKNVSLNIPSHLDLPEYKTSSKTVNPDFHDYTWTIVAEFFDPSYAYTFEQQLIYDNWENPLLLNGRYHLGEHKQFRNSGHSDKTKQKIHDAMIGKPLSDAHRKNLSDVKRGVSTGPSPKKGKPSGKQRNPTGPRGPNGKKGIPNGRKGEPSPLKGKPSKPCSVETKQKLRDANLGKPSPKKGKPSGRKGIPTKKKGKSSGKQLNPSNKPAWNKGISTGPRPKVECPHCGELVGNKRGHFDNCEKKPI